MNTVETTPPVPRTPKLGEPTWDIAFLFPTQGQWTESEYLALETNHLVELSDGCLEFLPMPSLFHQLIVDFVFGLLKNFVREQGAGYVLFAPLPIRLWAGTLREPDIAYFRKGRLTDTRRPPHGADLVIEVVSEGSENRKRDLETKRADYAKAGIAEYWIVDPEERRIKVLTLDGQSYREHGVFAPGSQATSVLLPGFQVAVSDVFAAAQLDQ